VETWQLLMMVSAVHDAANSGPQPSAHILMLEIITPASHQRIICTRCSRVRRYSSIVAVTH
jgi:hypothetical protein